MVRQSRKPQCEQCPLRRLQAQRLGSGRYHLGW
ncbi:hypothetical protein [Anabaenopsis arnoldii]